MVPPIVSFKEHKEFHAVDLEEGWHVPAGYPAEIEQKIQIFYDRSDILYVSIHGDPTNFYPAVAGFEDEKGSGGGLGFNINLPLPHGSTERDFFDRYEQAVRAICDFRADVVVLALGFDIYEHDPQSKVAVTTAGFAGFGDRVRRLGLPCLIVQEGGYHLQSLEENARAFFATPQAWEGR